jgi:hypothetical protein
MARTERSEKELSRDINAAIAGTEDEIFTDAMGDDELDNDGDTSLEEMGEGLEGDHLDKDGEGDDEDAGDEEDAEDKDAEEEDEASEDDEENEVRAGEEEQVRDDRGRFDRREPRIPPERLRHEAEQRRQAEQRAIEADQRYLTLEARFNDMQQRINAPQPQQRTEPAAPPPKPDMFVEPEKYEQWIIERANEAALQNVQRIFAHRDEQQRVAFNQNVDRSLQAAKVSERGFEFDAAYSALLKLNPQNPADRATVQSIVYSQDPGRTLFDWWDKNGGEDYREALIARLTGQEPRRQADDRDRGERRPARRSRDDRNDQPRHEIRPARPLRSLNSASGGGSHRVSDPEMLDGSDTSVFDFATRR